MAAQARLSTMDEPRNKDYSTSETTRDLLPVAGVKRPAPDAPIPSLLPAFEPVSSSPSLPRPAKRVALDEAVGKQSSASYIAKYGNERMKYPTPVPTSSTGIVSSSPPFTARTHRPPLQRTASTRSERAPLEAVPTIELNMNGEPTLLGRSGRASTFQLSTNKLISRVHVRAAYIPAEPPGSAKVELVCTGWNGIKVHCQSKAWELGKDDTFTSESQGADIMLDVQDARVILKWPCVVYGANTPISSESESELGDTPSKRTGAAVRPVVGQSPQSRVRLQSPISPTPNPSDPVAAAAIGLFGSGQHASGPIQIYEDESANSDQENVAPATQTQSTQRLTQPLGANRQASEGPQVESDFDPDEENDPIVHSFGAAGENLLPRMASFTACSSPPQPHKESQLGKRGQSVSPGKRDIFNEPIANHVANQLAFSRVASTPLSTIMRNLPISLKGEEENEENRNPLTVGQLKNMIGAIGCIGEVAREGRDAAGKPLESEYYYIPDKDYNENRRAAVVNSLQKPGLRNCRKSHKQYYWRKPK